MEFYGGWAGGSELRIRGGILWGGGWGSQCFSVVSK